MGSSHLKKMWNLLCPDEPASQIIYVFYDEFKLLDGFCKYPVYDPCEMRIKMEDYLIIHYDSPERYKYMYHYCRDTILFRNRIGHNCPWETIIEYYKAFNEIIKLTYDRIYSEEIKFAEAKTRGVVLRLLQKLTDSANGINTTMKQHNIPEIVPIRIGRKKKLKIPANVLSGVTPIPGIYETEECKAKFGNELKNYLIEITPIKGSKRRWVFQKWNGCNIHIADGEKKKTMRLINCRTIEILSDQPVLADLGCGENVGYGLILESKISSTELP